MITSCLRCSKPAQTGTPDPAKRAIVASATQGYCAECMITRFILSIEALKLLIEGSPARGNAEFGVPARPGRGRAILLDPATQKSFAPVLAFTQLPLDQINWERVVAQWNLPWPKGKQPKLL